MTLTCPSCHQPFESKTKLRQHIHSKHPDELLFACNTCNKRFKHESSMVRHTCVKQDHENTFETHMLQKKGSASQQKATSFLSSRHGLLIQESLRESDEKLDAAINEYIDTSVVARITYKSINNNLRWMLDFAEWDPNTLPECLKLLKKHVKHTQRAASQELYDDILIKMMDPYELVHLRNNIVIKMRHVQRTIIDPMIKSVLLGKQNEDLVQFGFDMMCPFLDLLMRFVNVPQRMQVTINLEMPDSSSKDYVSKLVVDDNMTMSRIVYKDKVHSSHQPIKIPLGRCISLYMHFYIKYCRPKSTTSFVFLTPKGKKWSRASRDVKKFLENKLDIPVEKLDPSKRFVHASRTISIACYSSQVDFDINKVRAFASLCRHSSAVCEQYYSIWEREHTNRRGVQFFTQTMPEHDRPEIAYIKSTNLVEMLPAPPALSHRFKSKHPKLPDNEYWCMKSVGCQTFHSDEEQPTIEKMTSEVPKCTACNQNVSLLGPYGTKKNKNWFGKYFLSCIHCYPDKRPHSASTFFPLGVKPDHMESISTTPRNIQEINKFIQSSR